MKIILLLLTSIVCSLASAQKTEAYYDYNWKPCKPENARFYSEVVKTDSGYLRNDYYLGTRTLQMSGLYEDADNKIANGYFHFFYSTGGPESFGQNVHNKKEGLWMHYHQNGMMQDSTFYVNGHPSGTSMAWYANGFPADSIVYGNDGMAVVVRWNTNGTPSSAGRLKNDTLTGPWMFFHKNGQVAATENYDMGVLKSVQYYDSFAKKIEKPEADRKAMFPGGQAGWTKYVNKHLFFPPDYKIVNASEVTVVVVATIDEEGNVTDAYVKVPFSKTFDNIALSVFRRCPRWLPAIAHNRAETENIIQPITFSNGE